MRRMLLGTALLALGLAGAAGGARAASIDGTWLTESGDTKVRIAPCGARRCGTIVWLETPGKDTKNPDPAKRDRPLMGSLVIDDLKPGEGEGERWEGQLYNYTSGKTYSGTAVPDGPGRMKLSGCVLGGLVCRSQVWTKAD